MSIFGHVPYDMRKSAVAYEMDLRSNADNHFNAMWLTTSTRPPSNLVGHATDKSGGVLWIMRIECKYCRMETINARPTENGYDKRSECPRCGAPLQYHVPEA
jgi:hypothetical protein